MQDSNLRRRKPTDLQSVPPDVCCVKLRWYGEKLQVSSLCLEQLHATVATNCGLAADWGCLLERLDEVY